MWETWRHHSNNSGAVQKKFTALCPYMFLQKTDCLSHNFSFI